jgi:hypothetical protein
MRKITWISMLLLATITFAVVVSTASHALAYKRQSSRENGVRVDVVPVQLEQGQSVRFEVRMNAHSGALDQDLAAVSVLKDDKGNAFQPTSWNGSPPGGHHRSGILTFPELTPGSDKVTLIIRSIGDVPERSFMWRVQR